MRVILPNAIRLAVPRLRHFLLPAALLIIFTPSALEADSRQIQFVAETNEFAESVEEYRAIWEKDGSRIVDILEHVTGLSFERGPIQAVVYEGISSSGYHEHPMKLRASYPKATKQGTLVHELSHRMIADLVTKDFDDHPVIFLFLYDAWVELWGKEFADGQVAVESARRGFYDYESAWRAVLALTPEERTKRWRRFLAARKTHD